MTDEPEPQESSIEDMLERQSEEMDRALLAELGRFLVAFSEVVQALERHTIIAVGGYSSPSSAASDARFRLIVGALTRGEARVAQETFFSVVGELGRESWNDADNRIVKLLRRRVSEVIEMRNRLSHDAWQLGGSASLEHPGWGTYEVGVAALQRVSRTKFGIAIDVVEYDAARLSALAHHVEQLARQIDWFAMHLPHRHDEIVLPPSELFGLDGEQLSILDDRSGCQTSITTGPIP